MADSIGDDVPNDLKAPPKKRPLFNKPAWSKPAEQEDGIDFFSRAKDLYPQRVAEEERRRQKKLVKLERMRSTASAERKASNTPETKRRRISSQSDDRHENSSDSNTDQEEVVFSTRGETEQLTPGSGKSNLQKKAQASQTTLTARYSRDLDLKHEELSEHKIVAKGVILLSDSENEDTNGVFKTKKLPVEPIDLDDEDGWNYSTSLAKSQLEEDDHRISDEEYPELVERARQREKQKELERLNARKLIAERNHGITKGVSDPDDIFQDSSAQEPVDPVIDILVTSCIDGSKPVIIRRKLSQRLREVRLTWCDRQIIAGQALSSHVQDSIFLTWNGFKLFDFTECAFLGIKIGSNGTLSSSGRGFDERGRLHFEAWTDELFMAHQRRLKLQQEQASREVEEPEVEEVDSSVKLILVARDLESYKMKVRPNTVVEKMIYDFRAARGVPKEKEIALHFDGDKLDPASKIEDTDLGDMDTVEVHIR